MAYEETDSAGQHYLWTHAGVTSGWMKELDEALFGPKPSRFRDLLLERNPQTVAEKINVAWEFNLPELYAVDRDSGGYAKWAGPLWVRPGKLDKYPLKGYNQIVGHTAFPEITKVKQDDKNCVHYYVDCFDTMVDALTLVWE
jgi:hypothetical protein